MSCACTTHPTIVPAHPHACTCALQAGEFILWEDAPLDADAKFYMIEGGSVDCFRTFEVGGCFMGWEGEEGG